MDGNGRWAKQRGKDRLEGHHQGAKSARTTVEAAAEIGVGRFDVFSVLDPQGVGIGILFEFGPDQASGQHRGDHEEQLMFHEMILSVNGIPWRKSRMLYHTGCCNRFSIFPLNRRLWTTGGIRHVRP